MTPKRIFLATILCWFVCCFPTEASKLHALEETRTVAGMMTPSRTGRPSVLQNDKSDSPHREARMDAPLSPAQAYAAELLAYLMQITLGRAGDPAYRDQWRVRGLNEPLNFGYITETMTEPDKNPLDLMVLDPNILDLTTVLYHYDKGLSLYEGDYGVTSIYPASEFIAIRLLLLKKIHKGEKVNLSALMAREDLIRNPALKPTRKDLRAMNLTAGELKFLQEIIQSKPHLFRYLKSPAMVEALWSLGAVREDPFVRKKVSQAGYQASCRHLKGADRPDAVKICFIPSMTDEFTYGTPKTHETKTGFEPTGFLLEMIRKLADEIRAATKISMEKELDSPGASQVPMDPGKWEGVWHEIAKKYLGFYAADQRPYVVYPENAARALKEICPQADFFVIVLGRNVYKSIYFDRKSDSFPAANRIYVDIMDIDHSQTDAEVQAVASFVSKRMVDRILELATHSPNDKSE